MRPLRGYRVSRLCSSFRKSKSPATSTPLSVYDVMRLSVVTIAFLKASRILRRELSSLCRATLSGRLVTGLT